MPEFRKIFVPVNDNCIDCNQKIDSHGAGYVVYDPGNDVYKRQCMKCHNTEKGKAEEFTRYVYRRKRQEPPSTLGAAELRLVK